MAAEEEKLLEEGILGSQRLDLLFLVEHFINVCGEAEEFSEKGLPLFFAHIAQARHHEGEEREDGKLARKGFGGADADLGTRAEE